MSFILSVVYFYDLSPCSSNVCVCVATDTKQSVKCTHTQYTTIAMYTMSVPDLLFWLQYAGYKIHVKRPSSCEADQQLNSDAGHKSAFTTAVCAPFHKSLPLSLYLAGLGPPPPPRGPQLLNKRGLQHLAPRVAPRGVGVIYSFC
jgi:hypothetical protein